MNHTINFHGDNHPNSAHVVYDIEVVIPEELNNADYVNDVVVKAISDSKFALINNELRWQKNQKGENIVLFYGAGEFGQCSTTELSELINKNIANRVNG